MMLAGGAWNLTGVEDAQIFLSRRRRCVVVVPPQVRGSAVSDHFARQSTTVLELTTLKAMC
jgi:hypothetical protein